MPTCAQGRHSTTPSAWWVRNACNLLTTNEGGQAAWHRASVPGCELTAAKRASRRAQKVARAPGTQKSLAICAQGRHSTTPSAWWVRNACNLLTTNEGGRAAWHRASVPGCELTAAKRPSRRAQKVARAPGTQKSLATCAQGRHSTTPSAWWVRNACNLLTTNEGGRAAWHRASVPGCELTAAKRASRRAQKVARAPGTQKSLATCAQGRHRTTPSAWWVRNACNLLTTNEGGRAAWHRASVPGCELTAAKRASRRAQKVAQAPGTQKSLATCVQGRHSTTPSAWWVRNACNLLTTNEGGRAAAKCSARLALQGNPSKDMMALAPGCFFWPSFCSSFPWSQLCRISENARWGSPWQM